MKIPYFFNYLHEGKNSISHYPKLFFYVIIELVNILDFTGLCPLLACYIPVLANTRSDSDVSKKW